MDVAQMLAHCQPPIRVAIGEQTLKRSVMGFLFGSMAKRSMLRPGDWKHGMPTDRTFLVRDARDFATEKERLIDLVTRLGRGGPAGLASGPHPFFGPLTPQEQDVLMTKHLDHHLRQFGA
jgi:hypothetical protein